MMKKVFVALSMSVALLVACSNDADESPIDTNEVVGEIIEVKVDILTPESVDANTAVKLEAKVTQGDEIINDADNVKFEVWESGKRDQALMLDGEFIGEGVFSAETTFDHDGVYYMFAHTNARGMHVMPKQQITVGTPDMSQVLPDDSKNTMNQGDTATDDQGPSEKHEEMEEHSHN